MSSMKCCDVVALVRVSRENRALDRASVRLAVRLYRHRVQQRQRGLEQMRGSWEPLHVAQALLSLASVRHALGAPGEARAMIDEARTLIEACHDPGILRERLTQAARALVPAYRRADQDTRLSERELAVLRVLATGATEREAAATLFVSRNTIHSHTKSIYFKLGSSSRDQALAQARELGLIT
jgi:LuxR family maltose regulon positive regulatory protein